MRPDEPTRVGYVLKMYPRLSETFIVNEMLAHESAGLDLEIFSLRAPIDGRFHTALGRLQAHVTYLPHTRLRASELWRTIRAAGDRLPGFWRHLEEARDVDENDVQQAIHLADAVRARGITHLHAHFATVATGVARLAGRLAGVPYTFTAHAKDIFHEDVDPATLGGRLRDAAGVVTVSDFNVEYLRSRHGADAEGVRRIYNGLDLNRFEYAAPTDRAPLILGVGRLVEKKGFGDLVAACAILAREGRTFRCEILGGGALHDALAAQIGELDLEDHVTLLGARSGDEVAERMRSAALLAVPCVVGRDGNRDGLPTVLLEAMAQGTPCVSTDVTGIPEIVEDGVTGLLAPQHDPSALAASLARLLDDRALGVRLAEGARKLVEKSFDIHRNTSEMRKLFAGAGTKGPRTVEVG